jgi:nicotinate-nucleotide pyrophosphorylase (carboxylating)
MIMSNSQRLNTLIREWLAEDLGIGDITSAATIPASHESIGIIHMKDAGVVAGLPVAEAVFRMVDDRLKFRALVSDGARVSHGDVIARVHGSTRSILSGERLALNLLQRMSGIATKTDEFVSQISGLPVRLVDTRKTTPGHRMLEKYAVRVGGGHNHRYGLSDAVMIKDNHIKAAGGIRQAITSARQAIPHTMKIEVETESLEQVQEAVDAGADIIMLDNMPIPMMEEAVRYIKSSAPHVVVEASGGVTLQTVRQIALTGVDVISVGGLTHSVRALDISLDLNAKKERHV